MKKFLSALLVFLHLNLILLSSAQSFEAPQINLFPNTAFQQTSTQVTLVETDGSVHTLSKSEFLSAWKGYTLAKSTVIPQVTSPTSHILSFFEARQLKGGCFFLIPAIIGAIVSIATTIGSIIYAIGTIIASIGAIIAQSLTLLTQAIGGFLTQVGAFAGQIFQGIQYVGTTLFHGLASLFSLGAPQGVAAGTLKVSASEAIFHNVITIGVNYAVSKGLDALGVDPRISNLISSFVTGGIHGSFTATGMDFSNFFFDGLKNTLVAGSKDLLVHAGLDPKLAGVISLTAAPLFDGAWTGDINGSIQTIASNLPRDLTIYGIDRLGASIGLDPRINALLTTTVSSALNPTHTEAKTLGENIIRSVQDGLLRGVTNLGISYATQNMDPLLGALTSRAITGAIEGALSPNHDIFQGIYQGFRDSALNVARLGGTGNDSYAQAQYLQRVTDFSTIIQQRGLAQAIDTYAANIFQADSVESIVRTYGSIQNAIQTRIAQGKEQTIQRGNQALKSLSLLDDNSIGIEYNDTHLLGVTDKDLYKSISSSGVDVQDTNSWGMIEGSLARAQSPFNSHEQFQRIQNGQQTYVEIKDSTGKTILVVTPNSQGGYNTFNSFGEYVDATLSQLDAQNRSFSVHDGVVVGQEFGGTRIYFDQLQNNYAISFTGISDAARMFINFKNDLMRQSAPILDQLFDANEINPNLQDQFSDPQPLTPEQILQKLQQQGYINAQQTLDKVKDYGVQMQRFFGRQPLLALVQSVRTESTQIGQSEVRFSREDGHVFMDGQSANQDLFGFINLNQGEMVRAVIGDSNGYRIGTDISVGLKATLFNNLQVIAGLSGNGRIEGGTSMDLSTLRGSTRVNGPNLQASVSGGGGIFASVQTSDFKLKVRVSYEHDVISDKDIVRIRTTRVDQAKGLCILTTDLQLSTQNNNNNAPSFNNLLQSNSALINQAIQISVAKSLEGVAQPLSAGDVSSALLGGVNSVMPYTNYIGQL